MDVVLENPERQIAMNTASSREFVNPADQQRPQSSLESAFWALAFALGIPITLSVFGLIRAHETKLAVDPRWAQFVPFIKLDETTHAKKVKSRGITESGRIPVQTASVRTEELASRATDHQSLLDSEIVAAEVFHRPIEVPAWQKTIVPENSHLDHERKQIAQSDQQVTDDPVADLDSESESANESAIAKSTVRIESQMQEVRQRLDQLVDRLAMQHVEHREESKPALSPVVSMPVIPMSVSLTPVVSPKESLSSEAPIRIRRKTGPDLVDLFTMDVHEADLQQFLVRLSEVAQVGIIHSPAVQGQISLHLHEVRLESALKAIVRSRDYVFEREHGIIVIRTADEAAKLRPSVGRLAAKTDGPR